MATATIAGITTTTTLPGAFSQPPATLAEDTGPWLGEADVEAAGLLLHNQFFSALQAGDVERLRALLVEERRGEAETLCATAQEWQKSRGSEAAWGGMTRPLVWTGQKYAWDPPLPVPDDLDSWIREHPEKRLGLQEVMGDNALWWFGMERSADGAWLVWPGLRDEEYALSHTLAGLATLQIDASPRAGVHVTVRLRQLPDSGTVSADLVVENKSDSLFALAASDLALTVDGVTAQFFISPHSPSVLEVKPGETERPGNGWEWGLEGATSMSTVLSYTPSDLTSQARTWTAEAP